jgi:hypothetical protein
MGRKVLPFVGVGGAVGVEVFVGEGVGVKVLV